ncbi:MAG: hypothetical protein VX974_03825 [Pseudomonadota bacterium]|nr:hypothetical protein [Pseudomonadota bacterium]
MIVAVYLILIGLLPLLPSGAPFTN